VPNKLFDSSNPKRPGNYTLANEKLNSNSVNGGKLTCGGKDWHYAATWEGLGYKGDTVPVGMYMTLELFSTNILAGYTDKTQTNVSRNTSLKSMIKAGISLNRERLFSQNKRTTAKVLPARASVTIRIRPKLGQYLT
jgi:hypothetical protein